MPTKECNRNFDSSPEEFSCGRKITGDQKAMLHKLIKNNPTCSSSKVSEMAQSTCGYISITIRHINRFRVEWGLSRGKGRPSKSDLNNNDNNLLPCKPQSYIGTKIFDDWMEQEGAFSEINILLKESIQIHQTEHPEDSFPLLRHKDITILRMFKALFYAPLYDIGKLTEYDIKEHALETIISRGYQSSTLNQFLGQLERIDAGKALIPSLIPKETEKIGNLCYIDGHMIAYWSTTSMHKGKITMLGRIMPGSNAIVAHNENGHSIFVEYQPPDIRLPKIILDYCESIVSLTGINLFVIDREINSVAMASAFDDRKWGLLSMLDKNEYKDLSDWNIEYEDTFIDGSKIYSGDWKNPRPEDPRKFVIVEKEDGQLLPYWATPEFAQYVDYIQWPVLYAQRTEIQENSFKRMIEHGALNVNYGTKKIIGPDRHQERKNEKIEKKLDSAQNKVKKKEELLEEQHERVQESKEREHSKRLSQRQEKLDVIEEDLKKAKQKEGDIKDELESLGPPKERADRDFRKQMLMTMRTLLLENALMIFFLALSNHMTTRIGIETLILILFKRSGVYSEMPSQIVYYINEAGLSLHYKALLEEIVNGLNAMNINRRGKMVHIRIRGGPI